MVLSKQEHLKLRALQVLDERIERKILPCGDKLPEAKVTTFEGKTFSISDMYKDKPLLLIFLR